MRRFVFAALMMVLFCPPPGEAQAELISCDDVVYTLCGPSPNCIRDVQFDTSSPLCQGGTRLWRCAWFCQDGWHYSEDWQECDCTGQTPPCDCLLAGSQVAMADGSQKPIESIRAGDLVLAFDENSKALVSSEVLEVHRPFLATSHVVINGMIRATERHPILCRNRWVPAGDLKVGDWMTGPDDREVPVVSIQRVDEAELAFNFRVAASTYVTHGVIVHNKPTCNNYVQECPDCPPGP